MIQQVIDYAAVIDGKGKMWIQELKWLSEHWF